MSITVAEALRQRKELQSKCATQDEYLKDLERELKRANTTIQELQKPKKTDFPMWLKVKECSCNITEAYLKQVLAQIQPIADVIHIEYGRHQGR